MNNSISHIVMPAITNRFQLKILHDNKEFSSLKHQIIKMHEDSVKKEISLTVEIDVEGTALVDSISLIHEIKNCVIVMLSCDGTYDAYFGVVYEDLSPVTLSVTDQLIWDYSLCKSQTVELVFKYGNISIAVGDAAKEISKKY